MEKENLLEDIKALLEEKMPKHDFNQETVANIGRVIGDAIKSKSEQYEQEVKSMEEEKVRIAEAEVQMTQDIAELKDKLESAESQVSSLSDDIQARESEEKFNARMEQVDASYELGEEDRKVLAAEVQELALEDEAFDAYSEKLAVMWAHKNKEYLAKQDELFKEKVEAEISKRLEGLETAKASNQVATTESTEEKEEAAEEVLEKAEAEEVVIVNNNSDTVTEEPSLRERFSQVFSKENLNIKF